MTEHLVLIGLGLLVTGCCAGAWLELTAPKHDDWPDEALGAEATIGFQASHRAAFRRSHPGDSTSLERRGLGGLASEQSEPVLSILEAGQRGDTAQPAAAAETLYTGHRGSRKLYVVED